MALLEIENLKTIFETREGPVKAVDGVSLEVEAGASVGVVGESGSGKSVFCLSLLRLIPIPPGKIVGGEALLDGVDLLKLPKGELRRLRGGAVSMIFQDPMTSLNPFLTVERQLTEVLETHKNKTHREALKASIEMLEKVGIADAPHRIHQYPHQFSGGMRQRVMIAMALLCRPKLLIADEPTTALDVTIQAQILDLLTHLQKEFQMAMILITHNLGVVAGVCDQIAVMYAGRIVEKAPADLLFQNPMHPYTRALIRSVPRLDEEKSERLFPIKDQPPDLSRLPSGCHFHPRCDLCESICREKDPGLIRVTDKQQAACWVTTRSKQ